MRAAPAPNGGERPAALLVLLTGAMLGPKDYDALFAAIKASRCGGGDPTGCMQCWPTTPTPRPPTPARPALTQAQTNAGVQLWAAAPHIDWQYMMVRGCAWPLQSQAAVAGGQAQRMEAVPPCFARSPRPGAAKLQPLPGPPLPLPILILQSLGFQAHEQWHAYGTALVREAVEAAQAEGFPLLGKPEGERWCSGRWCLVPWLHGNIGALQSVAHEDASWAAVAAGPSLHAPRSADRRAVLLRCWASGGAC